MGTLKITTYPSQLQRVVDQISGDLSASDTSLVDLVERHRGPLPQELMPLPSQGQERESPLEWTHLVDVASTFETERNPHYVQRSYVFGDSNHRSSGASSPQQSHIELQPAPLSRPSSSEGHIGLERKVTKLEATVKMLQEDLKKEREEKLRLQGQVKRLWEDNQRLQEESQTSATKLKKFTEWVFNTIEHMNYRPPPPLHTLTLACTHTNTHIDTGQRPEGKKLGTRTLDVIMRPSFFGFIHQQLISGERPHSPHFSG
ncbi:signal-induced proliferation-associated 1-like protein 1 [Notothenia coriiceps]|uniref:Signal-induced proliferation-associated 1-like protein 1 n=1 Tax=Notothenia coriiceps TaxID=8208 RepID=A0A6I9MMJ8_9TELE|nr:PREDICTED: signal-induced proliferation-associated 1-like protein 1 [Notothenia coriiceps]